MTCDDVLSRTRGQEKEGWFRSVHGCRLEKWRSAVHIIGCRRKKHIAGCRQVGVVAVLDNGRSGGLTSSDFPGGQLELLGVQARKFKCVSSVKMTVTPA